MIPSRGQDLAGVKHGGTTLGEGRADRSAQPRPWRLDRDDAGRDFSNPSYHFGIASQWGGGGLAGSSPIRLASGRLELPRPLGHRLLRPTRLPFRHEAAWAMPRILESSPGGRFGASGGRQPLWIL